MVRHQIILYFSRTNRVFREIIYFTADILYYIVFLLFRCLKISCITMYQYIQIYATAYWIKYDVTNLQALSVVIWSPHFVCRNIFRTQFYSTKAAWKSTSLYIQLFSTVLFLKGDIIKIHRLHMEKSLYAFYERICLRKTQMYSPNNCTFRMLQDMKCFRNIIADQALPPIFIHVLIDSFKIRIKSLWIGKSSPPLVVAKNPAPPLVVAPKSSPL